MLAAARRYWFDREAVREDEYQAEAETVDEPDTDEELVPRPPVVFCAAKRWR